MKKKTDYHIIRIKNGTGVISAVKIKEKDGLRLIKEGFLSEQYENQLGGQTYVYILYK